MRRGEKEKLRTLLFRGTGLLTDGGHILTLAALDYGNVSAHAESRSLSVMSVPTAVQRVAQHAARFRIGFVDRDLVARQRQAEASGESRGPRADNCHLAIGGWELAGDYAYREPVEAVGLVDGIGDRTQTKAPAPSTRRMSKRKPRPQTVIAQNAGLPGLVDRACHGKTACGACQ